MVSNRAAPCPRGLTGRGATFWRSVVSRYVFRPDELVVLAEACFAMSRLVKLEAAMSSAPAMVAGSAGQPRPNPMLAELRAERALLAALLRQLKIPDEPASSGMPNQTRTRHARHAARGRWGS